MKWRLFSILITVSFIIMAVYSKAKESSLGYCETKEMIVLRKVVHELLLSSGDSISRVLWVLNEMVTQGLIFSPASFVSVSFNMIGLFYLLIYYFLNISINAMAPTLVYKGIADKSTLKSPL